MQATAKDLRFHSKELLESIDRGEEVIITYRGKPHAKLIPIRKSKTIFPEEESQLFGIWKDNESISAVNDYVRNLRKGRF